MKNPKARQAKTNQWQELAMSSGGNGMPPRGPQLVSSNEPPRKPTLTQIFNESVKADQSKTIKQGNTKKQIEALRRKMSQPRATYEMTPLGSVNKARNPERDRKLSKTIEQLTKQMKEQKKSLKETFAAADKKNQLKQTFNQASGGMSM